MKLKKAGQIRRLCGSRVAGRANCRGMTRVKASGCARGGRADAMGDSVRRDSVVSDGHGRMAEWLKAPVLKTGRGLRSLVGSNPTPSASVRRKISNPMPFRPAVPDGED